MTSIRHARVQEQIKEIASTIVLFELKDPRLGFVTITRVELSSDMRFARIYYSVLGSDVDINLYESSDGMIWVLLEADAVGSDVSPFRTSTDTPSVGGNANFDNPLAGRLYQVVVKSSIDGTTIAHFNANDFTLGDSDTATAADGTGKTWTINGVNSEIKADAVVTVKNINQGYDLARFMRRKAAGEPTILTLHVGSPRSSSHGFDDAAGWNPASGFFALPKTNGIIAEKETAKDTIEVSFTNNPDSAIATLLANLNIDLTDAGYTRPDGSAIT